MISICRRKRKRKGLNFSFRRWSEDTFAQGLKELALRERHLRRQKDKLSSSSLPTSDSNVSSKRGKRKRSEVETSIKMETVAVDETNPCKVKK